jgi:crossover junction endodeoxyribonuclease RuvC
MEPPLNESAPRILGVDPGLNTTGYAVLSVERPAPRLCEAGVIRTTARTSLASRVAEIYDGVREVVAAFQPDVVALEQLFTTYKHPRTAILMGHARGVICLSATQAGVPVVHYAATQVKRLLTGNGRAPKQQMQRAVCTELNLDRLPEPHDVADALAVALCHYHALAMRQALARE